MNNPRVAGTLGDVSESKKKPSRLTREQVLCDFVRWMVVRGKSSLTQHTLTNNEVSALWLEFADGLVNRGVMKPADRERWANPFCRMMHR